MSGLADQAEELRAEAKAECPYDQGIRRQGCTTCDVVWPKRHVARKRLEALAPMLYDAGNKPGLLRALEDAPCGCQKDYEDQRLWLFCSRCVALRRAEEALSFPGRTLS
jgi:hypothetical protein